MSPAFITDNTIAKNLVFGSDHAGYNLKSYLISQLSSVGDFTIEDVGAISEDSVDYPDFANKLSAWMERYPNYVGVLICGSGIGISIAANRFKHIRAALCRTVEDAKLARAHNNANVLVLGSRVTSESEANAILKVFMTTEFEGGRHQNRVNKLGASK